MTENSRPDGFARSPQPAGPGALAGPADPTPGASAEPVAAPTPAAAPIPAPAASRPGSRIGTVATVLLSGVAGAALGLQLVTAGAVPVTVRTGPSVVAPSAPASEAARPAPAPSGAPQRSGGAAVRASASQSTGVVLIETSTSASALGAGTGMVLTADGLVLTNYHVVESSTQIKVTAASTGATYVATMVGHDATRDVAVLKLNDARGLTPVTVDDDGGAEDGDRVTAVGNANGQGFLSAASGTVTDTDATVTVANEGDADGTETLTDVLETDAAAQPGDSGGPMLDAEGEVVGMTTAGSSSSGRRYASSATSYAIGIEDALAVVEQVATGRDSGTVEVGPRAYLGISLTGTSGELEVASVEAEGPADKAGVERGAILGSIGGSAVRSRSQVVEALQQREPGERVEVTWTTPSGAQRTATITLGESPVN